MMKQIIFLTALFLLSQPPRLQAQTLQTWKSANGHSFEGTLVRVDGGNAVLEGTDGKEVAVPLAALDDASRALAESENQLAMKNRPAFAHQNRYLRFSMQPKGTWLKLEFLKGGVPMEGQQYNFSFYLRERTKNNKWKTIGIDEMAEEVRLENGEAHLRIKMKNGVIVKLSAKVNTQKEFEFSFEREVVPEELPPVSLGVSLGFPALLKYDMESKSYQGDLSSEGVAFVDLPEFLKGFEIKIDHGGGSAVVPYHEKRSSGFRGRRMTIHRVGSPPLEITGPKDPEDGSISTYFYGGKMPAEGYSLRFGSGNAATFTLELDD